MSQKNFDPPSPHDCFWKVRNDAEPKCTGAELDFANVDDPLSSKLGRNNTVKARFWPQLEPFQKQKSWNPFSVVPFSLGSGLY